MVAPMALGGRPGPAASCRPVVRLRNCRLCPLTGTRTRLVCSARLPFTADVRGSTGGPSGPNGRNMGSGRPVGAASIRMDAPEEEANLDESTRAAGLDGEVISLDAARLEAQVLEARLQSSSLTSTSSDTDNTSPDLSSFTSALRTRSRDWYQGLMSIEQTVEDGAELDYGGRRAKAGMLFASMTSHSQKAQAAGPDVPAPPDAVDWDALSQQQQTGEQQQTIEQQQEMTKAPDRAIGPQFSREEQEWRGIRDTLCFSVILALAGGPGPALELLGAGLDASAMALRQAHTHPQIIFFTASLVPFLAFIWEIWACGRQTRGVTFAFASLLIFVVAGIPLESYTESTFGELVSNVDSVHFAAQSLVTATNLAIILALQDSITAGQKSTNSNNRSVEGQAVAGVGGLKADSSLLASVGATAVAGAYALKHAGSQLVLHPSAGATVGDNTLYPLLCVGIPTALGAGLLGLGSKYDKTDVPGQSISSLLQSSLWAGSGLLVAAGLLAPTRGVEFIAEPGNALSLQTWSVHVISILEWSVAMALVWQYAGVSQQPAWKGLAWGMLPLHGSGLCAVVFHLWYNDPQLDWLISLQAFLTLSGNTTCWYAARRVRLAKDSSVKDCSSDTPEISRGTGKA